MHIAIVGAGIAGLACARRLFDAGRTVTVFERGDIPGGRAATMRTEVGGFDHGAQYYTARHPAFAEESERWRVAGIVERWNAATASIGNLDQRGRSGNETARWVGVPGMAAIGAHLATPLDVRYRAHVIGLDAIEPSGGAGMRWSVQRREDGVEGVTEPVVAITEGLFDAVIVATPAATAASLLAVVPNLARAASHARIEPCWALMLGFAESIFDATPIEVEPFDAAFVNAGRLAWIARESSKPGRRQGERWTVHAQSAWSVEHFDDDPEDAKAKLLRAFHEATGTREQPIYAAVHRWRSALVRVADPAASGAGLLWDDVQRIGACGDWCRGYRIEDAWLSGIAVADAVMASS